MHPEGHSGIRPDMTVGELVRLVDTHPAAADGLEHGRLAVETFDRDPDLDAEIMEGVRARRAPLLAIAGTGAAGWAAHGVSLLAGPEAHSSVVAGSCAAAVLVLPVLRARFRHNIPEHWRRRWWLAGLLGCGWVGAAAAWGPDSWTMTGALVVGGAALSARWWAEWEVPNPGETFEPEREWEPAPLAIEPSRAVQIEQAWTARVAAGRNPAAKDALLTGRTELPNGTTQWIVELDPEGSVGATEIVTKPAAIARALRMKPSNVIVERLSGDEDREDRARLTVVTRDLLAGGVPYQGPRYQDGRVPVGLYADGQGEAEYVAADSGGARSGLVTGDSGSGKSALLEAIVMGKLHSGVWRVLFGDGDPAGGSSPTLNEIADWAEAGPEGVLRQLRAVEALIKVRSRIKGALTDQDGPLRLMTPREAEYLREARVMHPCREWPGYVWVLDELHRLVTDDTGQIQAAGFVGRLERILRIGRKYGVVVLAGTQSLGGGDFGGSTMLRAQLASRNAFIMRSTNRSDAYPLNGIDVNPGLLPEGAGYAFVIGRGRLATMRVAWSEDMADWARGFPDCPGDEESALAIDLYRPKDDGGADAALQARLDDLDAWRAAAREGRNLDDETDDDEEEGAAGAAQKGKTGKPAEPVSVNGVSVPAPLGGKVIPLPARPATPAPISVRVSRPGGPLSANAARVLDVLRSRPGVWKASEVVETTGLGGPAVSRAFKELDGRGLARWRHGAAEALPAG